MRNLIRNALLLFASLAAIPRALSGSPSGPKGSRALHPRKRTIKRWLSETAVILAVMGVLGFLVAASGIVPIKASSGHWPITKWFLDFSKQRSVSFHSQGTKVPDLSDPAKVLRGAGHYETGCRSCHGSPSLKRPRIATAMTATPPYLAHEISKYEPEELFYIVKHGIKFTGMPAWPALHRNDEVWAVVAFLLKFPELDEAGYEELVWGRFAEIEGAPMEQMEQPDQVPTEVLTTCARCHGLHGMGRGEDAFPILAGQKPQYLLNQLRAFSRGERHSGFMEPIAAGLTEETMRELAMYFATRERHSHGRSTPEAVDAESIERGRRIALDGIASRKIHSCSDCHGPSETPANAAYPLLAGQPAPYIVQQLELFASEHRGGSRWHELMHPVAPKLDEQQRKDVAAFYESLSQ